MTNDSSFLGLKLKRFQDLQYLLQVYYLIQCGCPTCAPAFLSIRCTRFDNLQMPIQAIVTFHTRNSKIDLCLECNDGKNVRAARALLHGQRS